MRTCLTTIPAPGQQGLKIAPSAIVNKAGLKAAPEEARARLTKDTDYMGEGGGSASRGGSARGEDVSISDMINTMPKSGKFVIKKTDAGAGKYRERTFAELLFTRSPIWDSDEFSAIWAIVMHAFYLFANVA